MEQQYWTYDELAEYLGTTKAYLMVLVCRGEIPHTKIGKKTTRFSKADIAAWLAARTKAGVQ